MKSKLCALFGTRQGKEPRSIIPIISHIYAQFFLRTISYVSLQCLSSVHSISQIKFFLDERRRLARDRAKVKIRGGFHRRVALEPSTCSRGTLRSHYLMVITGTANWPRGLIATNCSITRVHTLERIVARIQLLLAYTATRDRGSYRCTLGRIVFQRRKPVTRE